MASPQLENGYTRIANEILDAFIGSKVTIPAEVRRIVDFVIRQTYGFNKKEDTIALSQFALATGLKKPSIIRAIHKAISMHLISRTANRKSWKYRFHKDFTAWRSLAPRLTVSPTANGVSPTANESLAPRLPTKDSKDIIQKKERRTAAKNMKPQKDENEHGDDGLPDIDVETGERIQVKPIKPALPVLDLLRLFQPVNPSYYLFVRNKTEIASIRRLRDQYGEEKLTALITALPEIIKQPYAPRITSPYQLETQMGKLKAFIEQYKETKQKTAWHIL